MRLASYRDNFLKVIKSILLAFVNIHYMQCRSCFAIQPRELKLKLKQEATRFKIRWTIHDPLILQGLPNHTTFKTVLSGATVPLILLFGPLHRA